MSEIDQKSAELSFLSSFSEPSDSLLLTTTTTPGSVAAAISSALETAAADHHHHIIPENHHHHHNIHQQQQHQFYNNSFSYQQPHNNYNAINNNINNNGLFNEFGNIVKSNNNLVNQCNSTINSTIQHQQQQQSNSTLFPVAPIRNSSYIGGVNHNQYNNQLLPNSGGGNLASGGICVGRSSSNHSDLRGIPFPGNHVTGDQQFRSSSACSQFHNHQISATSSALSYSSPPSSQMANKQEYPNSGGGSSSSSFSNNTTSLRDKSDNLETYKVSHCKEKPASDNRELDSGSGGGSCRVFKPSSKIIELPEKSTSASVTAAATTEHDQPSHQHSSNHHHHHQQHNKSKVPVGIAVAWQRCVTTSSTNPGNTLTMTTTMTTKADSGRDHSSRNKMSSLTSSLSSPTATPTKYPARPSSAISLKNLGRLSSSPSLYSSQNGYSSNPNLSGDSDNLSSTNYNHNRPMSACGDVIPCGGGSGGGGGAHVPFCPSPASPALSRPLPSSSVPPNMGYPTGYSSQYPPSPYHHRSAVSPYLDSYSYAAAAAVAAQRPFAVPSPLSSPHHHHHHHASHPNLLAASNGHPYWGLDGSHSHPPPVPLLSPGMSTSPGVPSTEYLQQLSLQQQQMQHHQQQLLNRQMSASPAPSSATSASPYNSYLPFLYPQADTTAASIAAAAAATMNKNPYYDHYLQHQHQQQQQQQQHQQQLHQHQVLTQQNHAGYTAHSQTTSIPTPPSSGGGGNNVGTINSDNSAVSGSNNNRAGSGGTSDGASASGSVSSPSSSTNNTHRAIPMQVASPINRTSSLSLLSCSPTGAGGLRTPTPTSASTSSSSSCAAASTAATSATTTTKSVTSSSSAGSSAFSSFSPAAHNSSGAVEDTACSSATTSQRNVLARSSSPPSVSQGGPSAAATAAVSSEELVVATTIAATSVTSASSPSPSLFLLHHQQQHPHLFSSSALSPKSLTSSTPSPVTVHDFNSGLNVVISSNTSANNSSQTNTMSAASARKNATPSPISLTPTRALLSPFAPGSPFSPSPSPGNNNNNGSYKDPWKEESTTKIKPIPINGHTRETHQIGGSSLTTPPPLSSPLLSLAHHQSSSSRKRMNSSSSSSGKITVSTPLSSPSSAHKHDFKRLESLIERRESESFSPLVLIPQHSPTTSTASSVVDASSADEQQNAKLASLAADENAGSKLDSGAAEAKTFCISVKLENPVLAAAESEIESYNSEEERSNKQSDALKVKANSSENDLEAEGNVCILKSDAGNGDQMKTVADLGESKEGVKAEVSPSPTTSNDTENPSIPIIPCDHANNAIITSSPGSVPVVGSTLDLGESKVGDQTKNQHGGDGEVKDGELEAISQENNNVPEEITLPATLSQSKNSGDATLNESIDTSEDLFNGSQSASNSFSKMNQSKNEKDMSLTSGYCSSHNESSEVKEQPEKLPVGECVRNVKRAVKTRRNPRQAAAGKSGNDKVTFLPEAGKRKRKKANDSESVKSTATATPQPEKPLCNAWDESGSWGRKRRKKGKLEKVTPSPAATQKKVNSDFLSIVAASPDTFKKKTRRGMRKNMTDADNETPKELKKRGNRGQKGVRNKKGLMLKLPSEKQSNKGKPAGKSGKKALESVKVDTNVAIDKKQQESWVAPMSPPSSRVAVGALDQRITSSSYFAPSKNTPGDQFMLKNTQEVAHPSQPQQTPMSVILHQGSSIQSPSQVTFVITSPTQPNAAAAAASVCGGSSSPLRIPAYIPRATGPPGSSAVLASTDELVGGGESYNGPATLTLHRDVDATTQQPFYQPPPAITIQYHHSAPATPLSAVEAASPSSLDLLATVAQEFGSRDDLGKRPSIDGGSSCNASSIGELSPPMSPQKSPAMYHQPPPLPPPPPIPHFYTNSALTPISHETGKNEAGKSIPSADTPKPPPLYTATPGRRARSPKKQMKVEEEVRKNVKTSNSISYKLSSKKAMRAKVGRKEKRTVSDSAFYGPPPPVVLLKIPQVPGLCNKKVAQDKLHGKNKKAASKVKFGDKVDVTPAEIPESKSINANQDESNKVWGRKRARSKSNDGTAFLDKEKGDIVPGEKRNKVMRKKKEVKNQATLLPAKAPLLSLPHSPFRKRKSDKQEKRKKNNNTKSQGRGRATKSASAATLASLLAPLTILPITTPVKSDLGNSSGGGSSPTKDKSPLSSGISPRQERISAFAKQAISRRTSVVSPTKPTINNTTSISPVKQKSESSAFFPIQHKKSVPNSPTDAMPRLTPEVPAPPPIKNFYSAAVADVAATLAAAFTRRNPVSSSSVPKRINFMRFPKHFSPNKGSSKSSLSLLPVVSSTLSQDTKDHPDGGDKTVARNNPLSSEQDKKKTENDNRQNRSGNSNGISMKGSDKSKKEVGRIDKSQNQADHKLKEETVRENAAQIKEKQKKVPKIGVIDSIPTAHASSSSHISLSPINTRKLCIKSGEQGLESRKSAFASLQVPGSSSTPGSSLASPNNVDDEGGNSTENENDFRNEFKNAWVADPMFAVSAIKVSSLSSAGSSQPTETEEESTEDDTEDRKEKRLKLSIYPNKNKEQKATFSLSPEQKSVLPEVKSQPKDSIQSKSNSKQLLMADRKKGGPGIKPGLREESRVTKSRSSAEDTADELDLEVAKITTQNAPGKKTKSGSGSYTATSSDTGEMHSTTVAGSRKSRKRSINRNSASYVNANSASSSQTKKMLSTKEIMTKVFSRKLSPDLSENRKGKRRRTSAITSTTTTTAEEMDADDEDDGETARLKKEQSSNDLQSNAQLAMSAVAAAVVVNSNSGNNNTNINNAQINASSSSSLSSPPSSSAATTAAAGGGGCMKKPMKRNKRSSTAGSSASTRNVSWGIPRQTRIGSTCVSSVFGGSMFGTRASTSATATAAATSSSSAESISSPAYDETWVPGRVDLQSTDELVDQMRILTDIQGLFYSGFLNALQPPDVYGVTLDNERGAPPHLIFSAEEVLEKCLREKRAKVEQLLPGVRICAYWSPQYSGLYPGRVCVEYRPELEFDPAKDLIPIEFDDGDTGMIKTSEIRFLTTNFPVREYDPNPLLTLAKKHRKRRHSSATNAPRCTGEHEEADCGESYCAKAEKRIQEEAAAENQDFGHHSGGVRYWTWTGQSYKRPSKNRKNRNKEFYHGIQRGNESIKVGESALFITTGNERPFIGRVERFWERQGKKMVNVRWFYHPEEVKASAKRLSNLKYPGALFESPHIDENDVQTIARKCDVLPFGEFKEKMSNSSGGSLRVAKLSMKSSSKPRNMYYIAGHYDPYNYNLTLKDLK